jgi:hypothetical protein
MITGGAAWPAPAGVPVAAGPWCEKPPAGSRILGAGGDAGNDVVLRMRTTKLEKFVPLGLPPLLSPLGLLPLVGPPLPLPLLRPSPAEHCRSCGMQVRLMQGNGSSCRWKQWPEHEWYRSSQVLALAGPAGKRTSETRLPRTAATVIDLFMMLFL